MSNLIPIEKIQNTEKLSTCKSNNIQDIYLVVNFYFFINNNNTNNNNNVNLYFLR